MSFIWGTVGGAIGWLALFGLPWASDLQAGRIKLVKIDASRAAGAFAMLICYVTFGGVAGLLAGGDVRSGVVAGIGGQAIIKALTKGASADEDG